METLSIFEEAKIVLKKNNYLEAAKLFEEAIISDGLSLPDKIFAWEKIRQIYQNLNKNFSLQSQLKMATAYKEAKESDKGKVLFYELFEQTSDAYFLKEAFDCCIECGNIKESREVANRYLKILINEKRPNDIYSFIKTNEERLNQSELLLWRIEAHLLEGNREEVVREYKALDENDHRRIFILQELIRYAERKTHFWQSHEELLDILLTTISTDGTILILSKKQAAKLILNIWMEKVIDQELLLKTMKVCDRYQLNFVGCAIANYLEDYKLANTFEKRIPQDLLIGDIDLARDLFGSDETSDEIILVRNIDFLKTMRRTEEVQRELEKLKKINPEHPYVSNIEADIESRSPEEIFKNLLAEVSSYSKKDKEKIEIDAYRSMANYYDKEYVQNNYEDMIIGLNLLNLPAVALQLSEMVDSEVLTEEDKINLEYLKLETLMILEEYFKVRDMVEDMLGKYPVKGDELYSLLYLRAEAYLNLGQYENAYNSFSEIRSLKSSYRLVNQRLKELEKYK